MDLITGHSDASEQYGCGHEVAAKCGASSKMPPAAAALAFAPNAKSMFGPNLPPRLRLALDCVRE